jgi:hypothetical protein
MSLNHLSQNWGQVQAVVPFTNAFTAPPVNVTAPKAADGTDAAALQQPLAAVLADDVFGRPTGGAAKAVVRRIQQKVIRESMIPNSE